MKKNHFLIKTLYLLIDFTCVLFAIFLACHLRATTLPYKITLHNVFLNQDNAFRFMFIFWAGIVMLFLFNKKALYQTRRELFEVLEISLVLRTVSLASLVMIVVIYAFKIHHFPRTVFFIGTGLMMVFLVVWRIIKRIYVEYLVTQGYNNLNALIIGAGKVGTALAQEIKRKPSLGINVVGYLDDHKDQDVLKSDLKILGKISDFTKIARKEFIDKIFITIPPDNRIFMKLLLQARDMGISVRVIPFGFELISGDFLKYNIGLIPVLSYTDLSGARPQAGKRIFDFILSASLIILLAPVFFVLALMIKIDSPGPIFYTSYRYGRNGRKFRMLKFRSMFRGAEKSQGQYKDKNEVDGPIFKIKKDPRVTKIGRFLRRYSLDELPQLFNVFLGQMSLVGPRPLPIEQIEKEDHNQLKRLEVRPGITGLWQIRGRSDISFKRLVRWDVWYINNWSFWLDLNILFQTIPVVCKGRGAY